MNYSHHFKKNIVLAYPVMLSQLGHIMVGFADSVMVGQVGVKELAGASLANSIFTLVLMFGIGVSYAITPLVAQEDGTKNYGKCGELLKNGLVTNCAAGIFLFIVLLGGGKIMSYLNQPDEVVVLAKPYLLILAVSILPFMIFQTFRQFCEGLSLTKQPMYITISANLINIGLNYVLIFGKLGIEPMGLVGAGWATLISRVFMALGLGAFVIYGSRFKQYLVGMGQKLITAKMVKRLLKLGLPVGFQFIFEVGAFASAAIMVGWLGTDYLAAHQIAINLSSLSYMMATGISSAATIRVGNQLGLKNFHALKIAGRSALIMAAIFMAVCGMLFIVGRFWLPTLYVNELAVVQIASSLLVIAALFQISDGVQVVALGALRGMEDVNIPTIFSLIAYWVIGLPVGYYLGFVLNIGVEGIWYGLLIGLTFSAILLLVRFNALARKKISTG